MENEKKLWWPILFDPIVFEHRPPGEQPCGATVPERKQMSDEELSMSSKPTFCNGDVPAVPELTVPPVPCNENNYGMGMVPFGANRPPLSPQLCQGSAGMETVREAPKRGPRPYDVALELMRVLPLRMVDNALYAFDGRVYRFVSTEVMYRVIMGNCRKYVEVVGDASLIERIYKVIQAEPGIVFRPTEKEIAFVALEDGLLDLNTFTMGPHTPTMFTTTMLNGNFARGQLLPCPAFDQFLHDVAGGDLVLVERIWQMVGYALVPDDAGKCFFLLQGVPDSGKSLLTNVITALVDEEATTSLDLSALGERFGASILVGKQICVVPDMASGVLDSKAVSMLKALTGGDVVSVDVKYQPRIKFRCRTTFLLVTNHALLTKDYDPAFVNRGVVIPFRVQVPQEYQNNNLRELLLMEKDAIIYNGLQAYKRLREQKFRFAGEYGLNEVTAGGMMGEEAPRTSIGEVLWMFCQQNLRMEENGFVSSTDLYDCFTQVTGTAFPGGVSAFSNRIGPIIDQMFSGAVTRSRTRTTGSGKQERGFAGINIVSIFDRVGGNYHG